MWNLQNLSMSMLDLFLSVRQGDRDLDLLGESPQYWWLPLDSAGLGDADSLQM